MLSIHNFPFVGAISTGFDGALFSGSGFGASLPPPQEQKRLIKILIAYIYI